MRVTFAFIFAGCGMLAASLFNPGPAKLVWNASESVTKGFYHVTNQIPEKGNLVLVQFPEWVKFLAERRGYLPENIPAMKRISAAQGDVVCRFSMTIFINQTLAAIAKTKDELGQRMPFWTGCRFLKTGEIFLLADHPDSFDGRYFGITKLSEIIGVAHPVWLMSD